MKTKLILAVCGVLLPVLFVWTALAADPNAVAELQIRGHDVLWSKSAGAKDLDKTVSFYGEEAMVMPPNAAMAATKEAVRKVWKDLFDLPGSAISWKTAKVEIAQSGDLAYSSGTYDFTMNDAGGKPVKEQGKYIEIWKKQADGKWKCVVDIWNSDLPATPPAPAAKK